MRRLCLLLMLMLLMLPAHAESPEPTPPPTLPAASSEEEVLSFLLMPKKYAIVGVKRGYLRYIAQNEEADPEFRVRYWLGGKLGTQLDLTTQKVGKYTFPFYARNMCSRAAYSMALSYLGIDITPGQMSAMMQTRDLNEPYDIISMQLGVERLSYEDYSFTEMVANYQSDSRYSPVYLYFERPNGTLHAVLVVATMQDPLRFLVVDTNPPKLRGQLCRVYYISLNKQGNKIAGSTFYEQLHDSKILQYHQWYLPGGNGQE